MIQNSQQWQNPHLSHPLSWFQKHTFWLQYRTAGYLTVSHVDECFDGILHLDDALVGAVTHHVQVHQKLPDRSFVDGKHDRIVSKPASRLKKAAVLQNVLTPKLRHLIYDMKLRIGKESSANYYRNCVVCWIRFCAEAFCDHSLKGFHLNMPKTYTAVHPD